MVFSHSCHIVHTSHVLFRGPSGRCTLEETYYEDTLHRREAFIVLFKALTSLNEVERRAGRRVVTHTQPSVLLVVNENTYIHAVCKNKRIHGMEDVLFSDFVAAGAKLFGRKPSSEERHDENKTRAHGKQKQSGLRDRFHFATTFLAHLISSPKFTILSGELCPNA